VAALFRYTRQTSQPYLPVLHTAAEDRAFFRDRVFCEDEVWVAEDSHGVLVGFCAYREGWIDHLYVHPQFQNRGIGSQLLEKAMRTHPHLQLWAFQANDGAIRFYERHGFTIVQQTTGQENEERLPDALLARGAAPAS